jgi:hypothetical protein
MVEMLVLKLIQYLKNYPKADTGKIVTWNGNFEILPPPRLSVTAAWELVLQNCALS